MSQNDYAGNDFQGGSGGGSGGGGLPGPPGTAMTSDLFTAVLGQTVFTLSQDCLAPETILLFWESAVFFRTVHFNVSGATNKTLTLTGLAPAMLAGQKLLAYYQKAT